MPQALTSLPTTASIYLIKKDCYGNVVNNQLQKVKELIIDTYNTKQDVADERYSEVPVNRANLLLFRQVKTPEVIWTKFLRPILEENLELKNTVNSFVMFILDNNLVYALSCGHGYHVISDYFDHNFSKSVIERTFDKTSAVFRSLQDRSLVGNILGASKIFRSNANIAVEEDYGKIFEKSVARIDRNKLRLLGIDSRNGCSCFAGSGFRLSHALTISDVLALCNKLSERLQGPVLMELNDISELQEDNPNIKDLKSKLICMIKDIVSGHSDNYELDFIHKEIFKFLYAETMIIKADDNINCGSLTIDASAIEVINMVGTQLNQNLNDVDMWNALKRIRINTYNDANRKQTSGTLLEHLHGEVVYNNKTWFYLNGKWLSINETLTERLNSSVQDMFTNMSSKWLNIPYVSEDLKEEYFVRKPEARIRQDQGLTVHVQYEEQYNRKYLNDDKTIVLDRVFFDGEEKVEVCDLLRIHSNSIELVHVKIGFSAPIRDVAEQIITSASVIMSWRKNRAQSGAEQYYEKAKRKYEESFNTVRFPYSKAKFIDAIHNKALTYTLAFVDKNTAVPFNIAAYNSVLAKIAVVNAKKRLSDMRFGMELVRIIAC